MPSDQINLGPVSPISNSDIMPSAIGDTKIITGGGSLNSTLSAGEGGNIDLMRVIKEIIQEENLKPSCIAAETVVIDPIVASIP
jgi:hypothetical protein